MNEQPPKSKRRWLRFSLRSMLLLVVVIAIPIAWKVNRARNQRVVVAELEKLNADLIYDYQIVATNGVRSYDFYAPPPGPKWLTALLGKEYFVEVRKVCADGAAVTNETLALIAKLPDIEQVELVNLDSEPGITDDGLVHFSKMQSLQAIVLHSNRISGVGLEHLTGLKRLTTLMAIGWNTDASLEHVSKLKSLEDLSLIEVRRITEKGLAQIAKLRNLRSLCIGTGGWNGDDSGIRDCMNVTESGLANLYELKNLESLTLNTTRVTRIGRDKLQKALPNCQIQWNSNGPNDSDAIDGDSDQQLEE